MQVRSSATPPFRFPSSLSAKKEEELHKRKDQQGIRQTSGVRSTADNELRNRNFQAPLLCEEWASIFPSMDVNPSRKSGLNTVRQFFVMREGIIRDISYFREIYSVLNRGNFSNRSVSCSQDLEANIDRIAATETTNQSPVLVNLF